MAERGLDTVAPPQGLNWTQDPSRQAAIERKRKQFEGARTYLVGNDPSGWAGHAARLGGHWQGVGPQSDWGKRSEKDVDEVIQYARSRGYAAPEPESVQEGQQTTDLGRQAQQATTALANLPTEVPEAAVGKYMAGTFEPAQRAFEEGQRTLGEHMESRGLLPSRFAPQSTAYSRGLELLSRQFAQELQGKAVEARTAAAGEHYGGFTAAQNKVRLLDALLQQKLISPEKYAELMGRLQIAEIHKPREQAGSKGFHVQGPGFGVGVGV